MEDDDTLQASACMAAWQGIGIDVRASAVRAIDQNESNLSNGKYESMQARVSEVTARWDLTRRASSSLCHATTGDGFRNPGNKE
jgi:hypothetical protein